MADERNGSEHGLADLGRETLLDDLLGRKQWRRSKFGYLTGLGPLRQSISTLGSAIVSAGASWRTLARALVRRDIAVRSVDVEDPAERFQASVFVHGRTEADLVALQRRSHHAFYLYAVLTIIAFVAGEVWHSFVPSIIQMPVWVEFVFRFATVPMLAAFVFRWGYVNYIVRNRSYLSAREYLRSGDWFPQPPACHAGRKRGSLFNLALAVAIVGAGVAAMPGDAFAGSSDAGNALHQAFDIFKVPGSDDLFMNLLSLVLPNVGPVPGLTGDAAAGSPAHNSLSLGLMIFSGILLMAACTMIAWHTITGTVLSAQTGKVLGERWSQVWSPARVVVGLGFLIPISGGFCGAQLLVLYLVAWGGTAANMIWTPYVQAMANGKGGTLEATAIEDKSEFIANLPGSYDVVRQIAERELCYVTSKTVFERSGVNLNWNGVPSKLGWITQNGIDRIVVTGDLVMSTLNPNYWRLWTNTAKRYATQKTREMEYGQFCGALTVSSINYELSKATVNNSDNAGLEAAIAAEYDKGRFAAVSAAQEILRPVMEAAVKTYFPSKSAAGGGGQQDAFYFHEGSGYKGIPNSIKDAVKAYNFQMLKAAMNAMQKASPSQGGSSASDNLVSTTNGLGWASAGMYYATLARVQGVVYARSSYRPSFNPSILGPETISADNKQVAKALYSNSETQPGTLADFSAWWIRNSRAFLLDNERAENAAVAGTSTLKTSLFGELSDGASWWLIDKLLDGFKINPFNAMLSLVELGHSILAWITALGAAVGAASLASLTPEGMVGSAVMSGAGQGGVIGTFFLTVGVMILSSLFAAGITLAYILPMIPYLTVTFFVMSMLILVAEAMVAAPLWAFMHVRMDGQEFVDTVQRPGYMISFNLLLRPSLMILGLIMLPLIHGAMAWFVWQTFKIAAKSATAGFSVGPVGAVVFLTLYAYLNYMIALRCFNLAIQVPDRVARWFGGQGEHTDEERLTQQAAGAISGNVARQASQLIDAGTIGGALGISKGGGGGRSGSGNPRVGRQADLGDKMRGREVGGQEDGSEGSGRGAAGGSGPGGGDQPATAFGRRFANAAGQAGRAVGQARRERSGNSGGAAMPPGGSAPPPAATGSNRDTAPKSGNGPRPPSPQDRARARRHNADPVIKDSARHQRDADRNNKLDPDE